MDASSTNGSKSTISNFFDQKCVFVTGATGFLGKFLVEKLLHSTKVDTIYVLVRAKRGVCPDERCEQFKSDPLFKFRLSEGQLNRIHVIPGDISEPGLGIDEQHLSIIKSKVQVIFHSAASIKFNDPLPRAVKLNVVATLEVLELAKECDRLESLVHVSTSFVNCHSGNLDEMPVNCPYDPMEVIKNPACVKTIDPYPNTYTLTKSLAEKLIQEYASNCNLPIAIARPSVVISSYNEPVVGYCDSYIQSCTAIGGIRAAGLLRIVPGDANINIPVIPVDLCVNAFIIVAAQCHTDFKVNDVSGRIFNVANSSDNQITFNDPFIEHKSRDMFVEYPFKYAIRKPRNLIFCPNRVFFKILSILFDWTFALFCDLFLLLTFQRPTFISAIKRALKQMRALRFFLTRSYNVDSGNMVNAWSSLSPCDQANFNFDLNGLSWEKFLDHYWPSIRKYAFKQKDEEEEAARKHLKKVTYISTSVELVLIILIPALIAFIINGCLSLLYY